MKYVTQWFLASNPPVRKGVYQRLCRDGDMFYAYWDNKNWYSFDHTIDGAVESFKKKWHTAYPDIAWRGVAR